MIYAMAIEGLHYIKFGKAKNPLARGRVLQTGCPGKLRVIAAVPWDDSDEGKIHTALAKSKLHGEWFYGDERTVSLVQIMMCPNSCDEERRYKVAMEYLGGVAVIPEVVFNSLPEVSKNVVLLSNPEVKRSVKRWDRDSWNAYMREYMKKHRALKKNA